MVSHDQCVHLRVDVSLSICLLICPYTSVCFFACWHCPSLTAQMPFSSRLSTSQSMHASTVGVGFHAAELTAMVQEQQEVLEKQKEIQGEQLDSKTSYLRWKKIPTL